MRFSRKIRFHIKNEELDRLADWLDTRFRGPFGIRYGWDGILGLIPIVGDLFTNVLAAYIIFQAAGKGYPFSVLIRMIFNFLFENLLNVVPVLGDIADFFFKANTRNMKLMRAYNLDPEKTKRGSTIWVLVVLALTITAFFAILVGSVYLAWTLGAMFWDFLRDRPW